MYVTLDYVISFAKTVVKTADNMDTNVWKDWIYTGALLHLGVSESEIDVAELKPKNSLARLPDGCRYILELALFDSSGNELKHKYRPGKQRIYNDQRLTTTSIGTDTNINDSVPVDVSNDAYNIILGTNGDLVTKILIRFFKYPLDENGNPLIREEDVFACTMFVKFMQAVRDNSNRSEIQQYDQLWKQAADKAKADKRVATVTPEVMKTITQEWMRLIPNFNHRLF